MSITITLELLLKLISPVPAVVEIGPLWEYLSILTLMPQPSYFQASSPSPSHSGLLHLPSVLSVSRPGLNPNPPYPFSIAKPRTGPGKECAGPKISLPNSCKFLRVSTGRLNESLFYAITRGETLGWQHWGEEVEESKIQSLQAKLGARPPWSSTLPFLTPLTSPWSHRDRWVHTGEVLLD